MTSSFVTLQRIAVCALLGASAPSAAQTFTLAGFVDDGDAAADGLFTFAFALVDDTGTLWSEEQPNTVVVGGVFVVDVGAATPLPLSIPSGAALQLTIDDDALPPMPLGALVTASVAARATQAALVDVAERVDGHAAGELATVAGLASAPGVPVAFANLVEVPADLADGDQGTVVASTAGGVVLDAAGTLKLEAVPGDRLQAGSVTAAKLPAGAVTSRHVVDGSLTGAQVADGTLPRTRLAAPVTAREVRTRAVFRVDNPVCSLALGTLTTSATCLSDPCTSTVVINGTSVPITGRLTCGSPSLCLSSQTTCPNTAIGQLVQP
jgi:hypothetical protein